MHTSNRGLTSEALLDGQTFLADCLRLTETARTLPPPERLPSGRLARFDLVLILSRWVTTKLKDRAKMLIVGRMQRRRQSTARIARSSRAASIERR